MCNASQPAELILQTLQRRDAKHPEGDKIRVEAGWLLLLVSNLSWFALFQGESLEAIIVHHSPDFSIDDG